MFEIHCHVCDSHQLVGARSIRSLHNTADGPLAYVESPCGHLLVRYFRDARRTSGTAAPTAA